MKELCQELKDLFEKNQPPEDEKIDLVDYDNVQEEILLDNNNLKQDQPPEDEKIDLEKDQENKGKKELEDFIEEEFGKDIKELYEKVGKNWNNLIMKADKNMKGKIMVNRMKVINKYNKYKEEIEKEEIEEIDYDNAPIGIKPEEEERLLPKHDPYNLPHPNEFKTCRTYKNCRSTRLQDKLGKYHYKKNELISLATKCGINIHKINKQGKKAVKTKSELCNHLKYKYGSKQFPKKVVKVPVRTKHAMINVEPLERNCRNDTDISDINVIEIPTNEFIKTANGKCYNINDVVEWMIVKDDQNIDLITETEKLWKSSYDKDLILSHPGLDPVVKKRYYNKRRELANRSDINYVLVKEALKDVPNDIFTYIGISGIIFLNDQPTQQDAAHARFPMSEDTLATLIDKINNSRNEDKWKKLSGFGTNINQILMDSINGNCLHGTGFKFSKLYTYWLDRINEEFGVFGLYRRVPDTNVYISFNVYNDLTTFPNRVEDCNQPLIICVYDIDNYNYDRVDLVIRKNAYMYHKELSRNIDIRSREYSKVLNYILNNKKEIYTDFTYGLYTLLSRYYKKYFPNMQDPNPIEEKIDMDNNREEIDIDDNDKIKYVNNSPQLNVDNLKNVKEVNGNPRVFVYDPIPKKWKYLLNNSAMA